MKRILLFFVISLILPSILNYSPAEAKGGQPFLQLAEKTYQTPSRRVGESVSHDFVFKNTGTSVLKIMRVSPSCNCTVASYDREVPPGGTGKVTLQLDIKPEWAGKLVTQSAVMISNDKQAKKTRLKLIVDVRP